MKTIIYKSGNGYNATTEENYFARVQDANKIARFSNCQGFDSPQDVADYLTTYCHVEKKDIIIK